MSGFLSQEGHMGIRTQSVKGTYADPGAASPNQGVFVRIRGGAMSGNRDLLIPDPEIGGHRDVQDALLGPVSFSGDFDMYPRFNALPTFLKGVLGSASSSGDADEGYLHTIAPAATIPWLSVEEKIANGYEVFKYTDVKVNTFHLESDANGFLMGTAGLIGLAQETTTATSSGNQRWDEAALSVGTNVLIEYNGVNLAPKSFSLDISNNIEDDDFRLGSLFLGDVVPKRRDVTGSITIRPEDVDLWKTAMWGAPGATEPLGTTTKDDLVITVTSYDDIPTFDPGVKYELVLTMPNVVFEPFPVEPSGDDVIEHDASFRAVRPSTGANVIDATVLNGFATVA